MPSVFVVKAKMENPMEWYSEMMKCDSNWTWDKQLEAYHLGAIYIRQHRTKVI